MQVSGIICSYIKDSEDNKEIEEAFEKLDAYKEQLGSFSLKGGWWNKSNN